MDSGLQQQVEVEGEGEGETEGEVDVEAEVNLIWSGLTRRCVRAPHRPSIATISRASLIDNDLDPTLTRDSDHGCGIVLSVMVPISSTSLRASFSLQSMTLHYTTLHYSIHSNGSEI
jgi:hypothetical protein